MKLKENIVTQKLGDEYVIFDNDNSTLHELNETGFLIVELLVKGKYKKSVIKKLSSVYKIKQAEAKKDYEEFIKELEKRDLIEE